MRLTGSAQAANNWSRYSQLPEWLTDSDGVGVLDCPAAVVAEGQRQHHCVGMYHGSVTRSRWFVSVRTSGGTSTAEVCDCAIVQHYGPANSSPTDEQHAALARWLATQMNNARAAMKRAALKEAA